MTKMTQQLVSIVGAGGGVTIDGKGKMSDQLAQIASASVATGATVIIKNANSKMTDQLVKIAKAGKGNVIFDFTK